MTSRASIAVLLIYLCAASALADEFKAWMIPLEAKEITAGSEVVVTKEGGDWLLTVGNPKSEMAIVSLVGITGLEVPDGCCGLTGRFRYRNVEGQGCLAWSMLWRLSAGEGFYIKSNEPTDGDGPIDSYDELIEPFSGSGEWRSFRIPCLRAERRSGDPPSLPDSIFINVVLPGKGSVTLRATDMQLLVAGPDGPVPVAPVAGNIPAEAVSATPKGADTQQPSRHWWSGRQAGLVGAIAGMVIGCWGALVGVLGGRGKARRLVMSLLWGMAACGAMLFVVGLTALFRSQPYHVYYPLLLCGGITLGISLGLGPVMKRRYAQIELRKISAMDVG